MHVKYCWGLDSNAYSLYDEKLKYHKNNKIGWQRKYAISYNNIISHHYSTNFTHHSYSSSCFVETHPGLQFSLSSLTCVDVFIRLSESCSSIKCENESIEVSWKNSRAVAPYEADEANVSCIVFCLKVASGTLFASYSSESCL